jgi:putative ABC transport system ATP-binding protein
MNILGCLDRPARLLVRRGEVGHLSRNQRARCGGITWFVFQGYNLLNRTSALENVELPLIYRGMPAPQLRRRVLAALAAVGLTEWQDHTPNDLSGGQQQRVAIARAIVTEPEVILADEPTGNLDSHTSREIMDLIAAFNRDRGITVVMVTHEPEMAAYAGRRVHFLDGRIESDARHGEGAR